MEKAKLTIWGDEDMLHKMLGQAMESLSDGEQLKGLIANDKEQRVLWESGGDFEVFDTEERSKEILCGMRE